MRPDPLHPQVVFNVDALSRLNEAQRGWLIDREREDYQAHIAAELADLNRLRSEIQRHRERIEWAGDVVTADEQSARRARIKHEADEQLWASVPMASIQGREENA